MAEGSDGKPFGFVLVLRGIAAGAMMIGRQYPAALRTLCVMGEYMNQDGRCRVGQDTVAARLQITRQAVNKQIRILIENNVIEIETSKAGAALRYRLVGLDDLAGERWNNDLVDERRAVKRRKKAGLVRMKDRPGWGAYKAVGGKRLTSGDFVDPAPNLAAMIQAERAMGLQFIFAKRDADGQELFKRCNLPTSHKVQPLEVSPGATARGFH